MSGKIDYEYPTADDIKSRHSRGNLKNGLFPSGTADEKKNRDPVIASDEAASETSVGEDFIEIFTDADAAGSPAGASFVYMDVGRWGGAGQGRGHWDRQRDFGVVHGPVVMLCTFDTSTDATTGDNCLEPDEKNPPDHFYVLGKGPTGDAYQTTPIDYAKNVMELLTHLSSDPALGKVLVRRQIIAKSRPAAGSGSTETKDAFEAEPIYVILGDMHIPIAESVEAKAKDASPYKAPDEAAYTKVLEAFGADLTAKILKPETLYCPVLPPDQTVERWGRVDLQPIKTLMEAVCQTSGDPLQAVKDLLALAVEGSKDPRVRAAVQGDWSLLVFYLLEDLITKTAPPVAKTLAELSAKLPPPAKILEKLKDIWDVRDERGVVDNTMSLNDAQLWHQYYEVGTGNENPADIFEDACEDFARFAKLLASSPVKDHTQFVQLGDMVDFWIGFSAYFTPSGSGDPYISVEPNHNMQIITRDQVRLKLAAMALTPDAAGIIPWTETIPADRCVKSLGHWVDVLLNSTKNGKFLKAAFASLEGMAKKPRWLYGNHDNYLGSKEVATALTSYLRPREDRIVDKASGVYMEHGHQWDSFNGNAVELMDVTQFFVGTPSTAGVFLTQAAFIKPSAIRKFEASVSAAIWDVTDNVGMDAQYGQRLNQIAAAIRLHNGTADVPGSFPFRIYVMGHTHLPALCNVSIKNRPKRGPESIGNEMYGKAFVGTVGTVDWDHAGDRSHSDQYKDVKFKWGGFPADVKGTLKFQDPWGAQTKAQTNYIRTPCYVSLPLETRIEAAEGEFTLPWVPPGALFARFFPDDGPAAYTFDKGKLNAHAQFVWQGGNADGPLMFLGLSLDAPGGSSMFAPGEPIPVRWALAGTWPPPKLYTAQRLFFELFSANKLTKDGLPDAEFMGHAWAVDDQSSEVQYSFGRTVIRGKVLERIKEHAEKIRADYQNGVQNPNVAKNWDVDLERKAGAPATALSLDFLLYMFGSSQPVNWQSFEDSNEACVNFEQIGNDSIPTYMEKLFTLWVRVRVPVNADGTAATKG